MAKRVSANAQFNVAYGGYAATIKVKGAEFPVCFEAGVAASDALKRAVRDALKPKVDGPPEGVSEADLPDQSRQ